MPPITTIPYKFGYINTEIRKHGLLGGLSIVLHRHVECTDNGEIKNHLPYNATHAECGKPYKMIEGLDFNALYGWSMTQNLPVGRGVLWENIKNKFTLKVMNNDDSTDRASEEMLEWLNYVCFCL